MMDQEWLIRDVFQQTAYVATDFKGDMEQSRKVAARKRSYDRDFVLPDFQKTFRGQVKLTPFLERDQEVLLGKIAKEREDESGDDEDFNEKDMAMEAEKLEENEDGEDSGSDEGEESDEEESPAEARRRLMKQRAEEDRIRKDKEEEQQVLTVSVERFTIPEALFRPSDAGLLPDMAGLPVTIVQAINASPIHLQAALYQSIHLVGGLAHIPGLKERLQEELRALSPSDYGLQITSSNAPIECAWLGACKLSHKQSHCKLMINRDDWMRMDKNGAWKSFLGVAGGFLV
jgi:actin-related protein